MRIFTFLIACLICMLVDAQWTDNYELNTLVADGSTSDIQSIGTNDGKTYVIFWDETEGYDLRIQLIDAEGNQEFGENGILANAIADNGTWTTTRAEAVDEEGNLYIGFTATNDGNGYVNKISPGGEQLYGENGIVFSSAYDLKVLPQTDGGVIVSWLDNSVGKIMRYNENGETVWDAPIEVTSPDSSRPFTTVGELSGLSDGSFIAVLHTKATSWGIDSIPYAIRIDAEGTLVWEEAIQISTQTLMSNSRYPIIQDGDTTYFGYYGSTGWRFDSFLQRINSDGTLPWGADGSDFSTDDTYIEMSNSIILSEDDKIWAISNYSDSNQSLYGVFVQKFDKESGERLLDDFGKEVFSVSSNLWVNVGNLQLANNKPLFLFSNGISNGVNPIQLGVVYLDENGDFAWEDGYEFIATTSENKSRVDFTKNVNGQSVAVWTEPRNGLSKSYAQNIVIDPEMHVSEENPFQDYVYPNPTTGILNIDSEIEISTIEIYDLSGKKLGKSTNSKQLDISNLPNNLYVLKVVTVDGKAKSMKVIKK